MTPLALGFSKGLENLDAAVAVCVAWYNMCRVHLTLRVTRAMQAGISGHIWTIEELPAAGRESKEVSAWVQKGVQTID
jgi:hypothetical protein